MFIRSLIFLACSSLFAAQTQALPVLDIRDGILFGASGVDVGGALYDVDFIHGGSCADLFTGCDSPDDFLFFDDQATAVLASLALLDQVFLDIPLYEFDSQPWLTYGCTSTDTHTCRVETPYVYISDFGGTDMAFIDNMIGVDLDGEEDGHVGFDFYGPDDIPTDNILSTTNARKIRKTIFARWSVQSVPEPTTLSLLGLGLVGLGWSRRKKT